MGAKVIATERNTGDQFVKQAPAPANNEVVTSIDPFRQGIVDNSPQGRCVWREGVRLECPKMAGFRACTQPVPSYVPYP
jgi:hypothetical protein